MGDFRRVLTAKGEEMGCFCYFSQILRQLGVSKEFVKGLDFSHVDLIHVVNKTNVLGAQPQSDFAIAQCFGGGGGTFLLLILSVIKFWNQVAPLAAASFQSITLVRNTIDITGNGEFVTERVMDDGRSLGFFNEDIEAECETVQCSKKDISWEVSVDLANGNKEACDRGRDCMEEQQSFFPELQDHHFERKFISSAEMQDKYLSVKEKKKRDRALKECKKQGQAAAEKISRM
ncbi:hypothetical protein V6N12_001086 [Hibiscus sabdariffa]|uniref:Uncharacterized protein n=1 Tax=Hibiscus sabdariffa TaxID=183260 RepID=A0ABR2C6M4_9ROSI